MSVNLSTTAGFRYVSDIRRWIVECHLNSMIHHRLAMIDQERLAGYMAGTKSFKPTRLAEAFLTFEDNGFWIREKVRQICMANSFIFHAIGSKQMGELVTHVKDRSFRFELGKRLAETLFWKTHKTAVRREFNNLKKVGQVMAD